MVNKSSTLNLSFVFLLGRNSHEVDGGSLLVLAVFALPTAALFSFMSESGDKDKTDLPAPVGTRITEMTANDASTGKPWSLAESAREAKAVVVFFMGTE